MIFDLRSDDFLDVNMMTFADTPALKTDFTRTGKRTITGALMVCCNVGREISK